MLKLGHRSFNREAELLDSNARKSFHNLPPSSNIERCALNGVNVGGNPTGGSFATIAQLVEQLICNEQVACSIHASCSNLTVTSVAQEGLPVNPQIGTLGASRWFESSTVILTTQ